MSKCTECKYERLSECEYPCNIYNPTYLQAILIYVRDKQTGYIHIVGTDQHDRLYLDGNGNIQYMNLQNGGTTEGDYEFVLDEQGHNQNNLTFTKEEQEKYGLSNMDDYFDSIDLETYMDLESKKRIQELTEINMRLVTEKQRRKKMNDIKIPQINLIPLKQGITEDELNEYMVNSDDTNFLIYRRCKYKTDKEWEYLVEAVAYGFYDGIILLDDWWEGQQDVE